MVTVAMTSTPKQLDSATPEWSLLGKKKRKPLISQGLSYLVGSKHLKDVSSFDLERIKKNMIAESKAP